MRKRLLYPSTNSDAFCRIETLAGVKTLEEDPYRHLFVPMYGQDLETRQKEVVDGIVGHLAELS